MSKKSTSSSSGGDAFIGLLTILFIGLKLTNYIDWSWWWVLSPIWIVFAVYAALIVLFIIIAIIVLVMNVLVMKS